MLMNKNNNTDIDIVSKNQNDIDIIKSKNPKEQKQSSVPFQIINEDSTGIHALKCEQITIITPNGSLGCSKEKKNPYIVWDTSSDCLKVILFDNTDRQFELKIFKKNASILVCLMGLYFKTNYVSP